MEKFQETLETLEKFATGFREFLEKSKDSSLDYIDENVSSVLQNALNCLIKEYHRVDEPENKKDNCVIHYTSISALESMLQNASKGDKKSSLRMYDSVHLNDPDEGSYFINNLNLPKKFDWLVKRDVSHAYITSFILPKNESKRKIENEKNMGNNLIFWQAYGNEGEGCSLALPVPRCQLQKVLYGDKKVKRTSKALRSILDSLEPLVIIKDPSIGESVKEKLAKVIWESLEKIRYLYKNEAFDYESECRLVVTESDISDKDKICFDDRDRKDSPSRMRHYYEHEELMIDKLLITGSSITLGPCVSYPYNVEYYLKTLMRRANLAGPKIKHSKISYRKP